MAFAVAHSCWRLWSVSFFLPIRALQDFMSVSSTPMRSRLPWICCGGRTPRSAPCDNAAPRWRQNDAGEKRVRVRGLGLAPRGAPPCPRPRARRRRPRPRRLLGGLLASSPRPHRRRTSSRAPRRRAAPIRSSQNGDGCSTAAGAVGAAFALGQPSCCCCLSQAKKPRNRIPTGERVVEADFSRVC